MEHDKKQNYLDKLKNIQGFAHGTIQNVQKDVGVLNDDSSRFNESHQQHTQPIYGSNDLLAQVRRYIKANPSRHITKNRLTIKKGLNQPGLQPNRQNKNNFVTSYGTTSRGVDFKNRICLTKPKHNNFVNYEPGAKIELGLPNASSTLKHQETNNISGSPKRSVRPKIVYENNTFGGGGDEKNDLGKSPSPFNCSGLSATSSSKTIKRNAQNGCSKTKSDIESNKNLLHSTVEGKAKLNALHCLYLEFIHSNCNELKSFMENDNIDNDYGKNLKNKLEQIQLKSRQNVRNANLTSSTGPPGVKENPIDSFNNISSGSVSNNRDFIFKPDINLFYSPGVVHKAQFSQDSFICSGPESSFTKTEDSRNIDPPVVRLEPNKEYFSSPDIFENMRNHYVQKKRRPSDERESSSISQGGGFKYYRRKMF